MHAARNAPAVSGLLMPRGPPAVAPKEALARAPASSYNPLAAHPALWF